MNSTEKSAEAASDNLLPCPFCGSSHVSDRHVRDGRQMFCINCNASVAPSYHGPNNDTLERARAAWNSRGAQFGGAPDDLHNLIKVTFADMTIERMNEVCKQVLAMRKPAAALAKAEGRTS
jgi:hypothetical protein